MVCADRAREAGLPGRFVAWLSATTVDAEQRLAGARGWYRTDGEPLVDTLADLSDGRMLLPLRIDERGRDIGPAGGLVTTGTYGGRVNSTCGDYTNPADVANVGALAYAGSSWTNVNSQPCSEPTRLYCFQIDHAVAAAVTPVSGRLAFISTATFTPSSGRNVADSICIDEAQAAGLPGTYLALLPTTQPAAARFDASGPPWVRLDGVSLGTTTELLSGMSPAALNVTTSGAYVTEYAVTGGGVPFAIPDAGRTCDAWTNPAGGSELGAAMASDNDAFSQTTAVCTQAERVYCLQQ
jgi:hypothetical protein